VAAGDDMSNPPAPPPEPTSNAGCAPGLMIAAGIILLLPGLCSIGFIAAFRDELNNFQEFWALWAICLAISAVGVYLFYAAEKARKRH
jgi:hypothetical protein